MFALTSLRRSDSINKFASGSAFASGVVDEDGIEAKPAVGVEGIREDAGAESRADKAFTCCSDN